MLPAIQQQTWALFKYGTFLKQVIIYVSLIIVSVQILEEMIKKHILYKSFPDLLT